MKTLFKFLIDLVLLIAILLALAQFSGNGYLIKALQATYLRGENSATIDDAPYFNTNKVKAGSVNWQWPIHNTYNTIPLSERLKLTLSETGSVAFLVIKNDSITHEFYWDGYSDSSRSNSFSMAKSITTMLAQIAIQKQVFKGWNQKVNTLLPDIKGQYANELELWHLSTMSSGQQWYEHYKNPFGITAQAYYGDDVRELILGLPIIDKPGEAFKYQSGSTQLLGLALTEATGKTLAELASSWLWKPLQAEHSATWHTDDSGNELAYCCFNSNARDFARLGKLMSDNGNFNGMQILDSAFTSLAVQGLFEDFYGYSFWLGESNGTKFFSQRGILGQYIIGIPEQDLVIVRLGHHRDEIDSNHPIDLKIIVEEVLKLNL